MSKSAKFLLVGAYYQQTNVTLLSLCGRSLASFSLSPVIFVTLWHTTVPRFSTPHKNFPSGKNDPHAWSTSIPFTERLRLRITWSQIQNGLDADGWIGALLLLPISSFLVVWNQSLCCCCFAGSSFHCASMSTVFQAVGRFASPDARTNCVIPVLALLPYQTIQNK